MIKVYIASAYTIGDTAINVKVQMDMAENLMNFGFAPFVPLYSHFQHMMHPRPQEEWLNFDLEWVKTCDCLLRLPGHSIGADIEVEHAKKHNIQIFYSIEELVKFYEN